MTQNDAKRIDHLMETIEAKGNPSALGLDTKMEYLPRLLTDNFSGVHAIRAFNHGLIDALADIVPCVKVQVACYEMLGPSGMEIFQDSLLYAREKGMVTIADVKRGDIGTTAEAYASAYLESGSTFPADFVTVNGYLGTDGIMPFLDACKKGGGGLFILDRTSNPSAGEFQDLLVHNRSGESEAPRPLYEYLGLKIAQWGENLMGIHGYSSVGAVVGATWPEEGKRLRALLPHTFFLVPGYGAQGAASKDLAGCFDDQGRGAVVNASRSLLCAHQRLKTDDFAAAARNEALRMRDDLRRAIRR
jgi:orotidine-5'-phosphate decarboxylase